MIDRILRFCGIVATITLVALGAAFFMGGEWDAWKAVRDARPDLAVADLRGEAAAQDARINALEAAGAEAARLADRLKAAESDIAALREAAAAAEAELAALRDVAAAETARVDAALAARPAYGDTLRIAPAEGEGALGLAPGTADAPQVTLGDTGTWRLLKAEE